MNILKKIQNKNIVRASIISAVLIISTVLSNIVASKAAVDTVAPTTHIVFGHMRYTPFCIVPFLTGDCRPFR